MTPPTSYKILTIWNDRNMSNNEEFDRFHVRKNPRLKKYDYSTPNYYFITICTWAKSCIFGSPVHLNTFGQIAAGSMREIEKHFPGVTIDKFVVMPNHVHAIVALNDKRAELPVVVGQFKSSVTKQIHSITPAIKVWQTSFHDHVIRNQQSYERIWHYIDTNPARWQEDCFYQE